MVSLVLLALWLPATLHCQIEATELSALFACGDAHSGTHGCDETPDACATIESEFLKTGSGAWIAPVLWSATGAAVWAALAPTQPDTTSPSGRLSLATASPPEIRGQWRFAIRAATPARAPSTIS